MVFLQRNCRWSINYRPVSMEVGAVIRTVKTVVVSFKQDSGSFMRTYFGKGYEIGTADTGHDNVTLVKKASIPGEITVGRVRQVEGKVYLGFRLIFLAGA